MGVRECDMDFCNSIQNASKLALWVFFLKIKFISKVLNSY